MKNPEVSFALVDEAEHSVVRPNEVRAARFYNYWAALRAYARVNDADVNRPFRKIFVDRKERERARLNVMSGNFVRDVNDARFRVDGKDDAFHSANEVVGSSEVRE